MSKLRKINVIRRKLTKGLTHNIGSSHLNQNIEPINRDEIKQVLICRPNHRLGNLLLITPLVQEIEDTFPNCKIDLFVKGGLGPIVFQNYNSIDQVIALPKKHFKQLGKYLNAWVKLKKKKYDLVINIDKGSSSGRLSTNFARSKYKVFGDSDADFGTRFPDSVHIAKDPIYTFRDLLSKAGIDNSNKELPCLNIKLNETEISQGKKSVEKLVTKEGRTIAIFTFATGAKCYSEDWWNLMYDHLKARFPNDNIIEVLPVENVSQIGFKAPHFYSKDVREIAAFIRNTHVFVGADSGIMHLASSAQVPVIGLFSVSHLEKYQPYGNRSVAINTNTQDYNAILKAIEAVL